MTRSSRILPCLFFLPSLSLLWCSDVSLELVSEGLSWKAEIVPRLASQGTILLSKTGLAEAGRADGLVCLSVCLSLPFHDVPNPFVSLRDATRHGGSMSESSPTSVQRPPKKTGPSRGQATEKTGPSQGQAGPSTPFSGPSHPFGVVQNLGFEGQAPPGMNPNIILLREKGGRSREKRPHGRSGAVF